MKAKPTFIIIMCFCASFFATGQNLVSEYEFDGTLTDRLNGSTLTAFGPTPDALHNNIEQGFLQDANGAYWYWKSDQSRGGGFWIDVNQDISSSYTVGLRFSYNQIGSSWKKIIDYNNRGSDNGFYFYNGKLQYYEGGAIGTGPTTIINEQMIDLIITRGTGSPGPFKAYFVINGTLVSPPELGVNISGGKPILVNGKPRFGFFFDDDATSTEATSGGKVYSIKIWDAALTEAQIQQALNPKATVANVLITGTTSNPITPKDVQVTLLQGETIGSAISANTNLSSWITNVPTGLTAKAKTQIPSGATTFELEVSGTPTVVSSAQIKITIPGFALTNSTNVLVAQNPDARFGIAPYTVTYNGNSQTSGSVPIDNSTYSQGSNVIVLSNSGSLSKTGYTFQGWNTISDGSGTQYIAGQTFTMGSSNVILYARWTPSGSTASTVTTQAASNINEISATCNGTITALGSPNPTAHGFCWSTNENPAIYNSSNYSLGARSTTGSFTYNLTGITPGTTYYVRAFATNTAGTVYGDQVSFSTNPNTWTGNANSVWNNASNWASSAIPTSTSNIVIPSSKPNYPVITNGLGITCNNLTLSNNANLTVSSGASLITNGIVTGDIRIERTITGSTNLNENNYHLVSVPLAPTNNSLSGLFLNSYLFSYQPIGNSWVAMGASTTTSLDETVGYMIYYPNNNFTYSFAGQPNTGTFTPTVNYAGNAGIDKNFALVPNPYPSNIDWNAASGWTKTNIGNSIWIYNNGNYAIWDGSTSTNGGSQYIAVGQAFFVQVTASNPALVMNNNVRTHITANFLKNATTPVNQIRIKALANNMQDEIVLEFSPEATSNYNPNEDALKFFGSADAPQMYTTADGIILSINKMFELNGRKAIPIYFKTDYNGEVTFEFKQIESFPKNLSIRLEDKLTNQWADIREIQAYKFLHNKNNEAERFVLHFDNATGIEENEVNTTTWISENTLFLYTPSNIGEKATVEIFNILGQPLYNKEVILTSLQQFDLPINGTIITRIKVGNQVFNSKNINL